jgi:hypothetical protein
MLLEKLIFLQTKKNTRNRYKKPIFILSVFSVLFDYPSLSLLFQTSFSSSICSVKILVSVCFLLVYVETFLWCVVGNVMCGWKISKKKLHLTNKNGRTH